MGKFLKSAYFYTVKNCKVTKPKKEGGGKQETPKFCFSVLSDKSAGFLVSSKPRKSNIRQIEILPEEINSHVPDTLPAYCKLTRISYANLAELRVFDEQEIASAREICLIPCSVAKKIVGELKKILSENFTPSPKDMLSPRDARKVIHELEVRTLRSR